MRGIRRLLAVGAAVAALIAAGAGPGNAEDGAGVFGTSNIFVVRGSAGGDGGGGGGSGGAVTVLTLVCAFGAWGGPTGPGGGDCLELPVVCPDGEVARQAWTSSPAGWQPGAVGCYGESVGIPVAAIAAQVRDQVAHHVPELRPRRQPARRALVHLPVLFHSGQPGGKRTWTDLVVGFPVTTSVTARWVWEFGDGGGLTTSDPGSRYPETGVSHTFRTPGEWRVSVRAVWDGTFLVAGVGPFAIDGEVTQNADLPVAVVEAHAVLVPDAQ